MSIPITIPFAVPGAALGDPGLAGAPPVTIDADGDGKVDAYVVNTGGGLVVTAAEGVDLDRLFGDPALAGAPPATIDFDGDGKADGLVVNIGGQLVVTPGEAEGQPGAPPTFLDLSLAPPQGVFVIQPMDVTFVDGQVVATAGAPAMMQAWIL